MSHTETHSTIAAARPFLARARVDYLAVLSEVTDGTMELNPESDSDDPSAHCRLPAIEPTCAAHWAY